MNQVVCKNVFISNNDNEISKKFNEVWQNIVNLIINRWIYWKQFTKSMYCVIK